MINYNKYNFSLRLCDIFKANFEGSIFLLMLLCVIYLSLNLYELSILFLLIL